MSRTLERAGAHLCVPFQLPLFETMRLESVPPVIAGDVGIGNGTNALCPNWQQKMLLWLIQVGVLRREVDGQGITDSFRLTPLGRQLVEVPPGLSPRTPSWIDYFYNALNRWFRLPF